MGRSSSIRTLVVLAVAVLAASGCSHGPDHIVAPGVRALRADSPTNAVFLFQSAWVNRDTSVYRGLFTSDFVFAFAARDSAGIPYQTLPWGRGDELIAARDLFVLGTSGQEPASSITLTFGNELADVADPRDGMDARSHRMVDASAVLRVTRPSSVIDVKGTVRLFLVRGEAASLPPGQGLVADSSRWYVERWEDYTLTAGTPAQAEGTRPLATQPARSYSWGELKTLYR